MLMVHLVHGMRYDFTCSNHFREKTNASGASASNHVRDWKYVDVGRGFKSLFKDIGKTSRHGQPGSPIWV